MTLYIFDDNFYKILYILHKHTISRNVYQTHKIKLPRVTSDFELTVQYWIEKTKLCPQKTLSTTNKAPIVVTRHNRKKLNPFPHKISWPANHKIIAIINWPQCVHTLTLYDQHKGNPHYKMVVSKNTLVANRK